MSRFGGFEFTSILGSGQRDLYLWKILQRAVHVLLLNLIWGRIQICSDDLSGGHYFDQTPICVPCQNVERSDLTERQVCLAKEDSLTHQATILHQDLEVGVLPPLVGSGYKADNLRVRQR